VGPRHDRFDRILGGMDAAGDRHVRPALQRFGALSRADQTLIVPLIIL
jgi:hypothetical protein